MSQGRKFRHPVAFGEILAFCYDEFSSNSGRFFGEADSRARNKVGVLAEDLARQLYGSADLAIGQEIKLSGLPFTVIGTFKERVDTFGRSEVTNNTVVIPYTVSVLFTNAD